MTERDAIGEAKEVIAKTGLTLTKEFEAGINHYGLVATKPAS